MFDQKWCSKGTREDRLLPRMARTRTPARLYLTMMRERERDYHAAAGAAEAHIREASMRAKFSCPYRYLQRSMETKTAGPVDSM